MISRFTYKPFAFLLLLLTVAGCGEKVSKRLSLWRNDKIPYGTWYAYHHLQYFFSDAEVESFKNSPVEFYGLNDSSSAYMIIGNTVKPDEKELKAILNYAIAGNHVFISALTIGQNVLDSFRLSVASEGRFFVRADSLTISILDPGNYDSLSFTYPGMGLANYFTNLDSSITNILGKDNKGNANFVKFTYEGGGSVFLHLAPIAFTNFFLLHKENKRYYDLAMSSIPDSIERLRWDDYYRSHVNGVSNAEKSGYSKLSVFLNNEVLRWVFWLALLLFVIIYIFESRRKQRVVPVIRKLNNTSLDFVKTIGRLYYQRKDNKNLAVKMAAHFLGYVRTRYNLPTSSLTDEFATRLAYKSGYPLHEVNDIVQYIRTIEDKNIITDEELMEFNKKADKFYKQT